MTTELGADVVTIGPMLETCPAGSTIDELVALTLEPGGAIVTGWLDADTVGRMNDEIDRYLRDHPEDGASYRLELHDRFLVDTQCLHGLVAKLARCRACTDRPIPASSSGPVR